MVAEQNIDAERATPELKPCPFCGSADIAHHTFAEDELRDFVMCNGCGVYAQRGDCEAEPVEVWNRRSAAIGEGGLPELPTLDPSVEYCAAEMYEYAVNYARDAIAADRRGSQDLNALLLDEYRRDRDAARARAAELELNLSEPAPQAEQVVKTWQERMYTPNADGMLPEDETEAMQEEIADLRAQLSRTAQQKPVAWLEAEPSARGRPAHEVILGMIYSSRIHTKCAPMTSNPVWPLYAAPPLSSEQQATQKPCRQEMIAAGAKALPRTCPRHGLSGCPSIVEQQAEKGEK
jgi:Lar family restriction alleviation protein